MSDNELATPDSCNNVCLNYTDFLSASCKKRWGFVDAIYGVMPIFGMVTRNQPQQETGLAPEQLKELALQIISTQVSDEINIVRLIMLAKRQQITHFDILLPYSLSAEQLEAIQQEYRQPLILSQQEERLTVRILATSG